MAEGGGREWGRVRGWVSQSSSSLKFELGLVLMDLHPLVWLVTTRKRSLGQGNIFTPVCHSVHRGSLPQCMLGYQPPGIMHPSPRDHAPPDHTPPPQDHVPPRDHAPPRTIHPPPPGTEHAGRYGQRAGGTHHTEMQSCLFTYILISQTIGCK